MLKEHAMDESNTTNTEHQTSRRQFITEAVAAGGIVGLAAGGATAASLASQPSRTPQPVRPQPVEAPAARPQPIPATGLSHYVQFSANGEDAPVLMGHDTTRQSIGGVDVSNMIECLRFEYEQYPSSAARELRLLPARFLLRTGKSTPFIFNSMTSNSRSAVRIDLSLNIFEYQSSDSAVERTIQYRMNNGRNIYTRIHQPSVHEQAMYGSRMYLEVHVQPEVVVIESLPGGTLYTRESGL